MPRRLKAFQTHIGFYDLLVAAPSMKAAAEAWGTDTKLFAHGFAGPAKDPAAVAAAMADPGIVLRRLHGKSGAFAREPEKPQAPKLTARQKRARSQAARDQKRKDAEARKAARDAQSDARNAARGELADIAREEADLRARRKTLRKKFHLGSDG